MNVRLEVLSFEVFLQREEIYVLFITECELTFL